MKNLNSIDIHSATWRSVQAFIKQQRNVAIENLIADSDSEKQRGVIQILDKLVALPDNSEIPTVVQDDYT